MGYWNEMRKKMCILGGKEQVYESNVQVKKKVQMHIAKRWHVRKGTQSGVMGVKRRRRVYYQMFLSGCASR